MLRTREDGQQTCSGNHHANAGDSVCAVNLTDLKQVHPSEHRGRQIKQDERDSEANESFAVFVRAEFLFIPGDHCCDEWTHRRRHTLVKRKCFSGRHHES